MKQQQREINVNDLSTLFCLIQRFPSFFSCDPFSNICTFYATLYNRISYLSFA